MIDSATCHGTVWLRCLMLRHSEYSRHGNAYLNRGRFAHAETNVLRAAMSTLPELSNALISTAEPCPMCGGQRAQRSESHHLRHINRDPYPVRLVPTAASALRMWWHLMSRVHRCICFLSHKTDLLYRFENRRAMNP